MDSFVKVSHLGWGGRLMDSIKGVLVGAVLFLASFVVLFWNEGRAVKTAKGLAEGRGATVSLAEPKVDGANEGKLVHTTGEATTDETLTDAVFGVSAQGIKLLRKVEMYQWKETKRSSTRKKVGGGTRTETTYSYSQVWSEKPIDSNRFERPEGHENKPMPYSSEDFVAGKVTLGDFRLSKTLIGQMKSATPLIVEAAMLPEELKARVKASAGGFYMGQDPASPVNGDLKIAFSVVKPQVVSLISQQVGDTFQPYKTKTGTTLDMLSAGTHTADNMFTAAEEANVVLTWGLRFLGFVLMAIGLAMVARPLVVVADVIPFVGDILGVGVALFAGVVALCLSLVTIAIAWLFYRPVLAVVLIAIGIGAVFGVWHLARSRKAQAAARTT